MKFYIVSVLSCVVLATADKLNNVYLPPSSSITAGGNGNILRAPFNRGFTQHSIQGFSGSQQIFAPQGPSTPFRNIAASSVQPQIAILRFNNDNKGDGSYRFEYETENKIAQQEIGQLKNGGTDQESNAVQGSYSYVGPDGQTYTINYIADELGFRATGDHLPVAPAIPAEIQKSLEQNAADEAKGIIDDGQYRVDGFSGIKSNSINRQYLAPNVHSGYQKQQTGYRY